MRHGQTDESHRTAICCGDGCLYSRDKEQHGTHAVSVEAKAYFSPSSRALRGLIMSSDMTRHNIVADEKMGRCCNDTLLKFPIPQMT